MTSPSTPNFVIRQLQFVFIVSTGLLLVSLIASFYSIQKLIDNSRLVNHTQQVMLEAENVISYLKDAETGQRGYLLTLDPSFLQYYQGSYGRITGSYNRVRELTQEDPRQQKNLDQVKAMYERRYAQLERVIGLRTNLATRNDTATLRRELVRGKQLMNDIRVEVNRVKAQEASQLVARTEQQERYITFTPMLLLVSAIISMLITAFAFLRIKKDLDNRIAQHKLAEAKYLETASRISAMEEVTRSIADGDYSIRSTDDSDDELGRISTALNTMAKALEQTFTELRNRDWLQTGSVSLSEAIRGERNLHNMAGRMIDTLAAYLNAPLGTVYLTADDGQYTLAGTYATRQAPAVIKSGEGLVGQAIAQKKLIVAEDLPADYSRISSSLGEAPPAAVVITPLVFAGECLGAVELGLLRKPAPLDIEFMERNQESLSIGVNAALNYGKLQTLLDETQAQAEELQAQQTELEAVNAELEAQAQRLQLSEEELRVQQEELQQANSELEERGSLLEERNQDIQKKAGELEQANRYKSEFLANMSHELRTPLNSILLLSRLLAENTDGNLSADQTEYARVIQSSGNGLLSLIDEILDLSKIEAGQMKLDYQDVSLPDLMDELQSLFGVIAREKGLDFSITVEPEVPTMLVTDRQRLGQILKNLLANALKFTATGSVTLTVRKPSPQADRLSFVVRDTGIGIPPEKQPLIFEAFQQADGSTKRKYGGTGLGLSISRELAKLLGGDIGLTSEAGKGSEFILHLPVSGLKPALQTAARPYPEVRQQPVPEFQSDQPVPAQTEPNRYLSSVIPDPVPDDRDSLAEQDKVILIIEDDPYFARTLLDFARQKGYKGIVAVRGDEGLNLAISYQPKAILLDIQLPVMSGWEVMDALKANRQTRPIPVHIMSSHRLKKESLLKGAVDFMDKPVGYEQMQAVFQKIEDVLSRNPKKVLIVEDNPKHARALAYFLETFHITSELKSSVAEGVNALQNREVDCVILDMGIPDSNAYELLEEAKQNPGLEDLPIIIFTGRSLSMAEELKIRKYADSIVVKTAHSYQRMLDEVSLFLHLVDEHKQPENRHGLAGKLGDLGQILTGKTVLVADDDVRNIFSLTKALEQYNMTVVTALDGKEALQKLEENPGVDAVLLDMMMPQMDGYETARRIREQPRYRSLPVIAVTAKAMAGDRDKCIEAGASDYITKPVDIDQLLSLLRVWLYER
ncbi:hypothetical protein GCM10023189_50200 [Nibrella saemangeumensis]|uniref:histidine kinase n=1 Tax=Nibrella saemangeumensis TaxID=1084526 RepID=A0ABP8NJY3_9BACT